MEVKISVINIIILSVLAAVSAFFIIESGKTKRKYEDLRHEYDSVYTVSEHAISLKNDSIAVLKEKYTQMVAETDSLTASMELLGARRATIIKDVASYTTDTTYGLLQSVLPVRKDKEQHIFAGNQVKEMYSNKLELMNRREESVLCKKKTESMSELLKLKDRQLKLTQSISEQKTVQLDNCTTLLNGTNKELDKQIKRKRIWMAVVPVIFAVGLIL